ncbi:MAG: hypothetical protein POH28_14955 [Acidocella sp.]|nr:hypothetical protein [Acidocella sp.]
MKYLFFLVWLLAALPASAHRLICGGVVAPGLAYPNAAGHWAGLEITLCQRFATQLNERASFTPVLQDSDTPPATKQRAAIFLPAQDIPKGYVTGPVIANDEQAIMVPAGSSIHDIAGLAHAEICVEPGSPEDFHLMDFFAVHKIPLHEFVFQEPSEMHDAYVAGRCDAITARRSLLVGLRANEMGARRHDVILPYDLGDNPIRVATPAGHAHWAARVAVIIEETQHAS